MAKKRRWIESQDEQEDAREMVPEDERFRPNADFERLMRGKRRPYTDEWFHGLRFD